MKKRIVAFLICTIMLFGIVGCQQKEVPVNKEVSNLEGINFKIAENWEVKDFEKISEIDNIAKIYSDWNKSGAVEISGNEGKIQGLATFTEFPYLQNNPTLKEDVEAGREKLINLFTGFDGEKLDRKTEEVTVGEKKLERLSFTFTQNDIKKTVEVITCVTGNRIYNLIFVSEDKNPKAFLKTVGKISDSISINEEITSKNNLVVLEANKAISEVSGLQFNVPENWIKSKDGLSSDLSSSFQAAKDKNAISSIDFKFPVNGEASAISFDLGMKIDPQTRDFVNKGLKAELIKSMEQEFEKVENPKVEDIEINGIKGVLVSADASILGIKSNAKMIAVVSNRHLNMFMFVTDETSKDDFDVMFKNIIPTIKFV